MRRVVKLALLLIVLVGWHKPAEAEPVLQLDIVGGHYDSATETIISNGPVFQLAVLLTPGPGDTNALLADTYYISAAITPRTGPTGSDIGSFVYNGTTVAATDGMNYGTPPLDLVEGHPDDQLGGHDIYPTFYSEFAFQFLPANRATTYNTQDNSGAGPTPNATGGSYYALFSVDVSGLAAGYQLHFDSYNSFVKRQAECVTRGGRGGQTTACTPADIGVEDFAPFSHDAESGDTPPIPEPATILLTLAGLGAVAVRQRRRAGRPGGLEKR